MKRLIPKIPTSEEGQSLVELVIVTPILIFMLLGVFEVGWALRGYLVLTNVNREITRFAVRPGYLDYSIKDGNTVGYEKVLSHTFSTLAGELPLEFKTGQTSTLIISHLVVDTALPCDPDDPIASCDCNRFLTDPNYGFTLDDLILHPNVPTYEDYYARTFPATSTYVTQLNYPELADQLAAQNNKFNCELLKKGGATPASNNVIVTELFYNQPQLFGFPLISNPFTDPVPMYAHTAMRMVIAARSGENIDTVGPICMAYPLTIWRNTLGPSPVPGTRIDILGGSGGGDWGWLTWNPVEDDENYLGLEIAIPRTSVNDFTNVDPGTGGTDHSLSVGDWVVSYNGTVNSDDTRDLMESLVGREIVIPVWSQFHTGVPNPYPPPPTVEAYVIDGFIRVRIDSDGDIDIPGKTIWATFVSSDTPCS